jgi:Ca2+-binding EF-hand superfamily protein
MNSHLRKKGYPAINDAQEDFENGINLMNLINSLYDIPIPKHNKDPKMRPHKLDNITLALGMIDKAQIKTNFLKQVHLVDKDLKMILGMVWAIILDFQIKGISMDELTAKEGLLLWCQKKTAGYKDVKVENFSNSFQDGLAFCALIHRHRPDLLDFDKLSKSNPRENLELAFSVAENNLGIARLLDVDDIVNVPRPDERSVMTYVSEYFHCFASQGVKEKSAQRIQKFVQFNKHIEDQEQEYENGSQDLLNWIQSTIEMLNERNFGDTLDQAKEHFNEYKNYLSSQKPPKVGSKLDLESLYAQIQTKLSVFDRLPYNVPSGYSTEDIDIAWDKLERAEKERGVALRDNMFRFITKATTTISEEQLKEFESSFVHFDKDSSGFLDRIEFKAALSALGVPFKDEEAFNKVFLQVSEGNPKISKSQFVNYLITISEDKDTPDSIKASFQQLSENSDSIARSQLHVQPLSEQEIDYLSVKMPETAPEVYNYNAYVSSVFKD